MTTGLYLLRVSQCGISVSDLDLLSVGMVFDVFVEAANDGEEYDQLATQADIDKL